MAVGCFRCTRFVSKRVRQSSAQFAGLRESGLSFDVISRSPSSISLVFDAKTDIDSIVRIISLLVARQNPEPQSVQLPDKTVYSTLIPNSSVKIESETFGTFPITLIKSGDIVWTILHHKDSTIVTNDGKLLTEWLSTPLLTKRCAARDQFGSIASKQSNLGQALYLSDSHKKNCLRVLNSVCLHYCG